MPGIAGVRNVGSYDLVDGVISLVRGDYSGAVLSLPAMMPFVGTGAGIVKICRRSQIIDLLPFSEAAKVSKYGDELSVAGHSLTKHGQGARTGNSLFPPASGNRKQISEQAQDIVDDILTTPGTRVTQSYRARFGDTIEFSAPDGRGVVFDSNRRFLSLKEN